MKGRKIIPPYLKPGDEVAIISPSYQIDEVILQEGIEYLEKWGFKVRLGKNAAKQKGPFAGSDAERLSDLQEMTSDRAIRAVFCSRGGYGLTRIIWKVDFSALTDNPKWYIGFSDITILHMWLNEVCGIMSIHGDMPLNFNNKKKKPETFGTLHEALFGELEGHEWKGLVYNPKNVRGELTGGNLSLLYSLTGTKAEADTNGKILFIEDVGEYIYHIDRMLTSLKLAGKLQYLSALIVGGMSKMQDSKTPWGKEINETIYDIVGEYGYPVIFDFPAGHIADNRAFYIGRETEIEFEGDSCKLRFL